MNASPRGAFVLRTLGCKANHADSFALSDQLTRAGWTLATPDTEIQDVTLCVINSCTVTDEADRQSRAQAGQLQKRYPSAKIVYTGCGAEVFSSEAIQGKWTGKVIGNQDKPFLSELVQSSSSEAWSSGVLGRTVPYQELLSRHPMDREWPAADALLKPDAHSHTRVFLKVQEGCDSFCTYCIIPYGRGPSRSVAPERLIAEIQRCEEQGAQEVVLTGTNLGDYQNEGVSGPSALRRLVLRILRETTLPRIRLSSLDPRELLSGLIELVEEGEGRVCPHFHVSLQSPSTRILRLMKRNYGSEQVSECLRRIDAVGARIPGGIYVGMDLITGFPGESEQEHAEGMRRLTDLPWTRLHVFPYSERTGTPATRLPGKVDTAARTRRAREWGSLSLERQIQWHSQRLGDTVEVLLETPDREGRYLVGHAANYSRVLIPLSDLKGTAPAHYRNSLRRVRITGTQVESASQEVSVLAAFL